jgi:O-antigen/teichoic acid export membrane protein
MGFVGFGNMLNAVLGFAFLAAVARVLDIKQFGMYALLTTLLISITKLIDFGTNSVYVSRSIAGDDKKLDSIFFSLKLVLTLLTIPLIALALLCTQVFKLDLYLILVGGCISYGLYYTLYSFFQKDERYGSLVFLSILPALIKGLFAFLLIFHLITLNLAQCIAVFSLSLFTVAVLIPAVVNKHRHIYFTWAGMTDLVKTSAPAGFSQLIYESWPSIGNIIAKVIGGLTSVGIFSLANNLPCFCPHLTIDFHGAPSQKRQATKGK